MTKTKKNIKNDKDNFTKYLTLGMVFLVVITGVVFSVYSNKQKENVISPKNVSQSSGKAIAFNNDSTGVTVDIWEDFQCPVCKKFEEANKAILDKLILEKKVNVNYHILSFLGPESVLLANASACASDINQFSKFHNFVYSNQMPENSGAWTNESIVLAAKSVGIISDKFDECVKKGTFNNYVRYVANDGAKKNINATPTVFINGKEIDRNSEYFDPIAFEKALNK